MKSPSILGVAALTACLMAQPASAYSLSPPEITSHLTGQLTFYPARGLQPFICDVRFVLKTRGHDKRPPAMVAGFGYEGGCRVGMNFFELPWAAEVTSATGGNFEGGSWTSERGSCTEEVTQFSVSSTGVWTFPAGGCFAGSLTSDPPVTIAP